MCTAGLGAEALLAWAAASCGDGGLITSGCLPRPATPPLPALTRTDGLPACQPLAFP